jgi:hypothetical protein
MATQVTHAATVAQTAERPAAREALRRGLRPRTVATLACLALIGGYGIILTVVCATILGKLTEGLLFLFLGVPGAGIGWTIGMFVEGIVGSEAPATTRG